MSTRALRGAAAVALALGTLGMSAAAAWAQPLPAAAPEDAGMSSPRLAVLDGLLEGALAEKQFPGAVLLVGRDGKIVYRKAFGLSQVNPSRQPMDEGMIFDLASLTKPVATATAIMMLVERGRLRLWDKAVDFVPEFLPYVDARGSRGSDIRLWHLLTHTSGLPPYADVVEVEALLGKPVSTAALVRYVGRIRKTAPPGGEFVYSCLNYITLARVVEIVTGLSLAEFAEVEIFRPLGMTFTGFCPPPDRRERCVPTQIVDGAPLRGIVHDPLARLQGGVSGNAGLFSTADDLASFCEMMLNGGELRGTRILGALAVRRMTEVFPWTAASGRGFGWDLVSDYGTVRGDLFGYGSYGHSGYTGTSVWIDPDTRTFVVFLTNRVHPDDQGDIVALRSRVANVVAAAIIEP